MRKKWTVKDSFPDRKIAEAYLSPQVNKLKEKFHFENPKLFKIKKYVSQTLGWTEDEVGMGMDISMMMIMINYRFLRRLHQ